MSGERQRDDASHASAPTITVLLSTERPTATTNPYLTQLYAALPPQVRLRFFSMRAALLSRYDVLHLHWPEYLLRHRTALGTLAKQLCVAVLLLRLRLAGVPLVRTLHNVAPHEDKGWRERLLLRWIDRQTARWIRINATTPARAPATDTILHGHYRDWYAPLPQPPRVRGRLLHFGLLRPYKGVETLVATVHALPDPQLSLRIAGNPIDAQIRGVVERACAEDPRISARLQYVEDAVLAQEIGEAELVVLPYRQMHNSGTLLLALSLARPVLAPWSEANAAIADEVGAQWVQLYQGELDATQLAQALAQAQQLPADAVPDLSRRDWNGIGQQHYRSYLQALTAQHGEGA